MNKSENNRSLESRIILRDLKKFGKAIIYPTIGLNFAFPTMLRKGGGDLVEGFFPCLFGVCIGSGIMYATLANKKPEAMLPIALTQIGTNVASGVYEWLRYVKKRANNLRKQYS